MKQKLDKKTLNSNRIQAIQKSIIESKQMAKSINSPNKTIQNKDSTNITAGQACRIEKILTESRY